VQLMLQAVAEPEAELIGTASPRFGWDFSRIPIESLQTKRLQASDKGQTAAPQIVHEVLRSPGQPLDPDTRASMERRFGHNFAGVRVHVDAQAARAADAVGARAFTVGANLVFRQGEFAPQAPAGRALLAHELAHTIQQSRPRDAASPTDPEEAAERAADRAADAVMAGRQVGPLPATGVRIARQPAGAATSAPSLTEQGNTLLNVYASLLADADRRGRSGIRIILANKGNALDPTEMEKLGEAGPRPMGVAPLSESAAADLLRNFIKTVVQYPGVWKVEVARDERGVMGGRLRWEKLAGPPGPAPAPAPAAADASPASVVPEEVRQAMVDRLAWARQLQQIITSTIAEQDPTKLKNLIWYIAPVGIVKVGTKAAKATGLVESTEGMVSTARRAERLSVEAKQARLAKIRAAAEERYVEETIRDVETAESETEVVARPPETPPVKVDPRVRGYAHEDVVLQFGDVRATPAWFKTIDGYVVDSAARSYTYVEGERTIIVYERPNIISHKSTAITDPHQLDKKIMQDIDALRGFKGYRSGDIEIKGAGQRRLVFTVDEEALLETENVYTLESWRKNLRDIDFDWYVSRGTEMIPGPRYIKLLGLPEY
jgi:Domain of unknown function (DUF4157)